jgi:signal transduction histidine kinase/tetratricopeptide (TPR) repeat protein
MLRSRGIIVGNGIKWGLLMGILMLAQSLIAQSIDSLLIRYRSEDNPVLRRSIQLQLGWQYQTQGDFAKAIAFYKEALEKDSLIAATDELRILRNVAFCYNELTDIENSIAIETKILQLLQRTSPPDANQIQKSFQRLASLSLQVKDYKKAIEYNEALLSHAKADNDLLSINQAYNNFGYIYHLLGDKELSGEYFRKTHETLEKNDFDLNDDHRATILSNLGVMNANLGQFVEARQFFLDAYEIRKKEQDTIKLAQALNYLATNDYIQHNYKSALASADEALALLTTLKATDQRDLVMVQTYRIFAEIRFRQNDIKAFRKYNVLYTALQEQIIQKEKRRNKLFLDRQLEVERVRNEIRVLLSEQEKQKLIVANSLIAQEAKQNELQLKERELEILRQENELQEEKYLNTILKNKQINQMLELLEQRSNAEQQTQKIQLLEQDKKFQELQIEKRKADIEQLQVAQLQDRKIKNYNFLISGLLLLLLLIAIKLYAYRNSKNKVLVERNNTISKMNLEISSRNEELVSINDQLNIRTLEMHSQNNKLNAAHELINQQNEKLRLYNRNLEAEVLKRTEEIRENSERLAEYTNQMEKFTYAISHNLRAPIARLLGLINIISPLESGPELEFLLLKVKESSSQLDDVIKDLAMILELRADKHKELDRVNLRDHLSTVFLLHDDLIKEASPRINLDLRVETINSIGSLIDSMFYNLIGNSLKYRQLDRQLVINITSDEENNFVILRCSDNGIGIDLAKYGDKLFGLYKRFETRVEGKGLGLYLIKSHVESLQGWISVESACGKGTTFTVRLPKNLNVDYNQIDERSVAYNTLK